MRHLLSRHFSAIGGFKRLMRSINSLFAPHIVAMSEPDSDGLCWSYIFGDENKFELRKFRAAEDAHSSYSATLTGLWLGSPEINIKLIKLDNERARSVTEEAVFYHEMIERHL